MHFAYHYGCRCCNPHSLDVSSIDVRKLRIKDLQDVCMLIGSPGRAGTRLIADGAFQIVHVSDVCESVQRAACIFTDQGRVFIACRQLLAALSVDLLGKHDEAAGRVEFAVHFLKNMA